MNDNLPSTPDNVIAMSDRAPFKGRGPNNPGDPPGGDDMDEVKRRVTELEKSFLQTAVNIASIKAKVDDLPNKDWVHLRLWAIAGVIITAVGLMIRFLPPAGQ